MPYSDRSRLFWLAIGASVLSLGLVFFRGRTPGEAAGSPKVEAGQENNKRTVNGRSARGHHEAKTRPETSPDAKKGYPSKSEQARLRGLLDDTLSSVAMHDPEALALNDAFLPFSTGEDREEYQTKTESVGDALGYCDCFDLPDPVIDIDCSERPCLIFFLDKVPDNATQTCLNSCEEYRETNPTHFISSTGVLPPVPPDWEHAIKYGTVISREDYRYMSELGLFADEMLRVQERAYVWWTRAAAEAWPE